MPREDRFQDITILGKISLGAQHTLEGSLLPDTDDLRDLGSATARFRNLYLVNIPNATEGNFDTIRLGNSTQDVVLSRASANTLALASGDKLQLDEISAVGAINNILFVDGQKYATIDAAVAALGSSTGLVVVPHTYAGADLTPDNSSNAVIMDLRSTGIMRIYSPADAATSAGSTVGQIFLRSDTTNTQPTVTNLRNRLMAVEVGSGGTGTAVPIYGNVFWQGNMGGGSTQAHNGVYGEVQLFNITGWDAADAAIGGEFKGSVSGTANTAQPEAWGVFGQGQVVAGFDDTAAKLIGVRGGITVQATGAGTITDAMALFAAAFSQGGTTAFTNAYGLYVEPPGVGTNRWGIYSGGATTRNQIVGYLEIDGDTTVGGTANIGLSLTAGNAQVIHATNPQWRAQDTTNGVVAKVQALDSTGRIGTETAHNLELAVNNSSRFIIDTNGHLRSQGTALVAGDFALHANFGSGASVSAIAATDQGGRVTITTGTTAGANPTATLTFKGGTWTNAPAVVVSKGDLVAAAAGNGEWRVTSVSATQAVFTFDGTPSDSTAYVFDFIVMGR